MLGHNINMEYGGFYHRQYEAVSYVEDNHVLGICGACVGPSVHGVERRPVASRLPAMVSPNGSVRLANGERFGDKSWVFWTLILRFFGLSEMSRSLRQIYYICQ